MIPAKSDPGPMFRYLGGKWRLAPWIIAQLPAHRVYVEPFGGSAGLLLRKPRSEVEVLNDLDSDVVNFYRVLRDATSRGALIEALELTPAAREEFEQAFEPSTDPIERARRFAVRAMLGFGSAGGTKTQTGMRICNGSVGHRRSDAQRWARYPQAIAQVGERLEGVLIEHRHAVEVMLSQDGPETCHYLDPPYCAETRNGHGAGYRHELTDADHLDLLTAALNCRGAVVISGYYTDLYAELLQGFERTEISSRISAQRGTALRTECLWVRGPRR